MRIRIAILCLVVWAVAAGAHASEPQTLSLAEGKGSPPATIDQVAWIAGHWTGEGLGGISEEIWSEPDAGSMMAVYRSMREGEISFYEILTIAEHEGSLVLRLKHFNADMTGWEEKDEVISFPLVKVGEREVFFDGMTFRRSSDTEMLVVVRVGGEDGHQEASFTYTLAD